MQNQKTVQAPMREILSMIKNIMALGTFYFNFKMNNEKVNSFIFTMIMRSTVLPFKFERRQFQLNHENEHILKAIYEEGWSEFC